MLTRQLGKQGRIMFPGKAQGSGNVKSHVISMDVIDSGEFEVQGGFREESEARGVTNETDGLRGEEESRTAGTQAKTLKEVIEIRLRHSED